MQGHTAGTLLRARLAQPSVERLPDGVHHRADRPRLDLYEIDVLGETGRWFDEQLVQGRAAAEGELLDDHFVRVQLDERPGQDEILLDQHVVWPWGVLSPRREVGSRDHCSGSTSSLRTSRQRSSIGALPASKSGRSNDRRTRRAARNAAS